VEKDIGSGVSTGGNDGLELKKRHFPTTLQASASRPEYQKRKEIIIKAHNERGSRGEGCAISGENSNPPRPSKKKKGRKGAVVQEGFRRISLLITRTKVRKKIENNAHFVKRMDMGKINRRKSLKKDNNTFRGGTFSTRRK